MCVCWILLVIFIVGLWFSIGTDPIKGILEVVRIFKRVIGVLWHKKRYTYLVFAPGSWHKAPKIFPISWVISMLGVSYSWCRMVTRRSKSWLEAWKFQSLFPHPNCWFNHQWPMIPLKVLVVQSCRTVCDRMDYSVEGSSVHGILQARILKWVVVPFSRGSSQPRDRTWVSCIAGRFFTIWATRETQCFH